MQDYYVNMQLIYVDMQDNYVKGQSYINFALGVQQPGNVEGQNRSTEGCSRLKRSVDMTSSGKNGLNIRTNASPKWDRTRCPEE